MGNSVLESAWGGIPETEKKLEQVFENEHVFKKTCTEKKRLLRKIIKGVDKQTLREFLHGFSQEIFDLEEEMSFTSSSQFLRLEKLAEIEFFFRECRSIVAEEVDRSILERREAVQEQAQISLA